MSANPGKWSDQWSVQQRQLARELITKALKTGALVRQPCEVCGAAYALAHHENYDQPLAVEKGPQVGYWREIGGKPKPTAQAGRGFDLAKYRSAVAQPNPQQQGVYPQGEESLPPSPQETQREPQAADNPHDLDELAF
jgi:hypothetical protein